MSPQGAEEDGVDNREEAPSGAPGEGPDDAHLSEWHSEASGAQADPAGKASNQADGAATEAAKEDGPSSWAAALARGRTASDSAARPVASGQPGSVFQPAPKPATVTRPDSAGQTGRAGQPDDARQSRPAAPPTPAWSGLLGTPAEPQQPVPPADPLNRRAAAVPGYPYSTAATPSGAAAAAQTAPLPTVAAAAVADSMRGIASKVGSSFSGLGKLTEKARPGQAGPPPAHRAQPGPPPRVGRPPVGRQQGPNGRGQTRRAQLTLERLEPWSVMKFSFLISLVCWVVFFVVVAVLYFTLSKLGVFHHLESDWSLVTSNKKNPSGSQTLQSWFSASRILGYTMLIGAVNVVLMTALATIGAVVYNLITVLTGGIEVTLKESD